MTLIKNELRIYKKRKEKKIKNNSTQNWLSIKNIFDDGIIETKEKNYIKIIRIFPINFYLKSQMEKESILNSYKLFLKTCNFNIQIIIQTNKEEINDHIKKIEKNILKENNNIKNISKKYCEYLIKNNLSKKSSSKKYYILIIENSEKKDINLIKNNLNNNYLKIKECLIRCGNRSIDISDKSEIINILLSFIKPL